MVMVLSAQAAVTPEGKPEGVPIPVALVVLCVILVNRVLIHKLCEPEIALAVISGVTVMVTAEVAEQPLELVTVTV